MKTDNEKIAEFMGLRRQEPGEYNKVSYWMPDSKDKRKKGDFIGYFDSMRYDTSWDWLMPVVQKIRSVGNTTGDFNTHLKLWDDILNSFGYIDIKKTYDASLAFITWYQSLSKP